MERGSLTIWFDDEFLQSHWQPVPTGKRGAPFRDSDEAIRALLGLKAVLDRPYRRVEGPGRLDRPAPGVGRCRFPIIA